MPSSGVQTCALRSEEHTSELQSRQHLVCRLLLEKKIPSVTLRNGVCSDETERSHRTKKPEGATKEIRHQGAEMPTMRERSRKPLVFFFNDTATTEIYTLSLHDALPISMGARSRTAASAQARTAAAHFRV